MSVVLFRASIYLQKKVDLQYLCCDFYTDLMQQ